MTVVRAQGLVLQVHEAVARIIDSGEFKPGDPVNISELARRFEVSSTPVREALARLAAERRLSFHANLGYTVPTLPTAREYSDWAAARIAVESSALQHAFGPLDSNLVARAQSINDEMRDTEFGAAIESVRHYSALNQRFHEAIVAIAHNPFLSDMQRGLYAGQRFASVFIGRGMPAKGQVVAEHQAVLDALRIGDAERAARALRRHIVESLERDARIPAVSPALRRLTR